MMPLNLYFTTVLIALLFSYTSSTIDTSTHEENVLSASIVIHITQLQSSKLCTTPNERNLPFQIIQKLEKITKRTSIEWKEIHNPLYTFGGTYFIEMIYIKEDSKLLTIHSNSQSTLSL